MKLIVLYFPSKRRNNRPIMAEAQAMANTARDRGHDAAVLQSTDFSFIFDGEGTSLYYKKSKFIEPDVLIGWVGMLNNVSERMALLQEVEMRGIPTINRRIPVVRARNKFQTLQLLSAQGLPVIKTALISKLESFDLALEQIGDFPVVAKTVYGNDGKGVAVFESKRSLLSGLELMLDNNVTTDTVLIQEFVKADNKDYRLFVVGDQVVAQMERSAPVNDFRANLASGGGARPAHLPKEVQDLAIEAAKIMKLEISGVDILLTDKGPIICEVNPRPGFLICQITGVDVTEHVVDLAEQFHYRNLAGQIKVIGNV